MKLSISQGELRNNERQNILNAFERLGFELGKDPETDEITATRPLTLTKHEFKGIVVASEVDTEYYAGVTWARLRDLATMKKFGHKMVDGLPLDFLQGSWSSKGVPMNLLVADTLPPAYEWLVENASSIYHPNINIRFLRAVEAAKSVVESQLDG